MLSDRTESGLSVASLFGGFLVPVSLGWLRGRLRRSGGILVSQGMRGGAYAGDLERFRRPLATRAIQSLLAGCVTRAGWFTAAAGGRYG